jgi:hypothetical protein
VPSSVTQFQELAARTQLTAARKKQPYDASMSQPERVRTRIQSLDERLARLRAEKIRLIARTNQTERRRDTRRKILIGGAVLAAVEHEGVPSAGLRRVVVRVSAEAREVDGAQRW